MYKSTLYITDGQSIEPELLRCKYCGKNFIPAPYHVYRHPVKGAPGHKYYMFCKWSCLCEFRRNKKRKIKKVDIEVPAKYTMKMDGNVIEVNDARDFEKKVFGGSKWKNPTNSFANFRKRLKKLGTTESYGYTFSDFKKNYECKEEYVNEKYKEQYNEKNN